MINLSTVLVNNELKYRLCKLRGNLTNFSAIFFFDCIAPLCVMPSLSMDDP